MNIVTLPLRSDKNMPGANRSRNQSQFRSNQASLMVSPQAKPPFLSPGYYPVTVTPKPVPTASVHSQAIRFGSCMCPICLSIGIIENAYDNIGKIKEGATVEVGTVMKRISGQTGYDYMVHENGTRLVTPAKGEDEENRIKITVMNRSGKGQNQTLEVPPEGGLFTTVYSAYLKTPNRPATYPTYPKSLDVLPLNDVTLMPPAHPDEYQVLSILHQMYPENQNPKTTPVSLGYMLVRKILPTSELAVMSTREFPTMENMDAAPAGLTNLLSLLAFERYGKYDTLAVAIESGQEDVTRYVQHLNAVGLSVKPYVSKTEHEAKPAATLRMPDAYRNELNKLFPQDVVTLVQIDLKPLKSWLKDGLPENVREALLKADPAMKSKLPEEGKKGLSAQDLLTVLRVPPKAGSKVFDSHEHDHEEDDHCHLPDLTFEKGEAFSLNLDDDDDTPQHSHHNH